MLELVFLSSFLKQKDIIIFDSMCLSPLKIIRIIFVQDRLVVDIR